MVPAQKKDTKKFFLSYSFKYRLFIVGLILFSLAILSQLSKWQIWQRDRFTVIANEQIAKKEQFLTKRGTITSQDGVVLAVDRPVWDLVISVNNYQKDIDRFQEQKGVFLQFLANNGMIDYSEAEEKLSRSLTYVPLIKDLSSDQKKLIEKQNFSNLFFEKKYQRFYPNSELASHIIGFIGKTTSGQEYGTYGLEGYFWGDLKGSQGRIYKESDIKGDIILSEKYKAIIAKEGKNLTLTINTGIQQKVEKLLKKGVQQNKAKSGTIIIMNPRTGAIVAMANYPNYNPNFYWQINDYNRFKNKAVADVYEFGSVNKALTVATGLERKAIKPNTICNNHEKFLKFDEKRIYNYNYKVYGSLTPPEVLKYSVNICAAKFGLKIGAEDMYTYLRKFGLGDFINIGLQEEETSYLKDWQEWLRPDLATIAFGQTISATPLQIVSAFSALANDGIRMQPYLVKEIYNDQTKIEIKPYALSRVVSSKTAKETTKMLSYAQMNSANFSKFKGIYNIAGKTGTAQIAKKNGPGYHARRTNATFVGYAPANDPTMVMLLRLEEPGVNELSSLTSVPLWIKIFEAVKDDLHVTKVH